MRPGESIEIRAANAVAGVRGTVVVAEVSSAAANVTNILRGQMAQIRHGLSTGAAHAGG